MPDSSAVRVGVTGGIYVAPDGTSIPVDPNTSLNVAFEELGYADESGVVEQQNEQTQDIRAWQGAALVRRVQTQHDATWTFTAIETNEVVLEQYYGNFSGSLADGEVRIHGGLPGRKPWVIEVIDGEDLLRIVIPEGEVTSRGQVTYNNGSPIGYQMTVTGYPSDDLDGDNARIYRTSSAFESA